MPVKPTFGALQNLEFNAVLDIYLSERCRRKWCQPIIKAAITVTGQITIRSGYCANAEIVLEHASKILAVPESTVEFNGDSTFVYVLTDSVPSQKFKRQQIEVGMSDGIKENCRQKRPDCQRQSAWR